CPRRGEVARGDALFLAGVFKAKVPPVGKTHCRAWNAATGQELYRLEVGTPSGQGVGSGTHYYLPVRRPTPGVCKIDVEKGEIVSHSRCRDDEVLGNLVYY